MYNYISGLLVFFLLSCSPSKQTNQLKPLNPLFAETGDTMSISEVVPYLKENRREVKTINVPTEYTDYSLVDIVESYRIVPLETKEECLIGEISKLCTDKGLMVIFDESNQSVFRFSSEGNFLGSISKKGRGPQEFVQLCDVSLDKKNKEICLLDVNGKKLLYYSYSGVYLREQPMFFYFFHIDFFEDKIILDQNKAHNIMAPQLINNNIVVSSRDQKPLFKGFVFSESVRANFNYGISHPFQICENRIYYTHVLTDTIWQIEGNQSIARFVLDFPERNELFTRDQLLNMTNELFKKVTYSGKNRSSGNDFLITKDFLYTRVNEGRVSFPLLYCVSTGNVMCGRQFLEGSDTDLSYFLYRPSLDFAINDTDFITVIQPMEVHKRLEDMKRDPKYQVTKEISDYIGKIKKEDNPILLISTLKKF